jgi:nitrate/TMAO reductase-like tetraheme cytochrome c subunit
MNSALFLAGLIAGILLLGACLFTLEPLLGDRRGRLLLLLVAVVLPFGLSAGGLAAGVERSTKTSFCASCHEMTEYGQSLFVDNPKALSAVHYQQRLIGRDQTCYACHTDYALFGTVKAKLNGLKHVWVHYTGGPRGPLELYEPYPNRNCLHCHDDARGYLDVPIHRQLEQELQSDAQSCLSCHSVGHDLEGARAKQFWYPEEP